MKTMRMMALGLVCTIAAHADFSYTQTRKGGPGGAAGVETKMYYKGQKMATVNSMMYIIVDFDAQTMTALNQADKSYTVTKFSDLGQAMKGANVDAQVDVKQTGEKKNINGYNASQVMMNMAVESPQAQGMKMNMEIEMWLSSDPPGAGELRAFYQRNMDKFPWAAMSGGGANPGMQKAMADMQKAVAKIGGVPVQQIVRMKGGNSAQTAQMQQGMAQARERLEAMKKAGGPQAQAAERALAQMGAMGGGGGGGSLFETTMESTGFSTASVPDSVFAIPAGYAKK